MHAVGLRADVQPPPVEPFFLITAETVGIRRIPGITAEQSKLGHRVPPRHVEHLVLVEEVPLVFQLFAQVA